MIISFCKIFINVQFKLAVSDKRNTIYLHAMRSFCNRLTNSRPGLCANPEQFKAKPLKYDQFYWKTFNIAKVSKGIKDFILN